MTSPLFKKAERKQAKLRLGISGPAGSGKTFSALQIAFGIGGRIAVIDTEHSSAELYAHLGDYDVAVLDAPVMPHPFGCSNQPIVPRPFQARETAMIDNHITPGTVGARR